MGLRVGDVVVVVDGGGAVGLIERTRGNASDLEVRDFRAVTRIAIDDDRARLRVFQSCDIGHLRRVAHRRDGYRRGRGQTLRCDRRAIFRRLNVEAASRVAVGIWCELHTGLGLRVGDVVVVVDDGGAVGLIERTRGNARDLEVRDFGAVVRIAMMTMAPDCVSSRVVILATCGVSPTGVTVIVEVAAELWAATVVPSSDDSTSKLPAVFEFTVGVNLSPALASANVM